MSMFCYISIELYPIFYFVQIVINKKWKHKIHIVLSFDLLIQLKE